MRILSFDIGGTAIKYGLVNEVGEILEKQEIPTNAQEGGEKLLKTLLDIIGRYEDLDSVTICTAGQVNSEAGYVLFASNLPGWADLEIKKIIEEKYKIKTYVENDVNSAALGEAIFGAGKDNDDFICIAYGTGIGGAIINNKKVFPGSNYSAGEFGHSILYPKGIKCGCGLSGCYEKYASAAALVEKAKETLEIENLDGRKIFKELNGGNDKYKDVVNAWLDDIIIGLVNIIHVFNPSLIVLGGGVMEQDYIIEYINKHLYNNIMEPYKGVKIKNAELGNNAGLLGAACKAIMDKETLYNL